MFLFSFVLFAGFIIEKNFHLFVEHSEELRRRKKQTSFEDENGLVERKDGGIASDRIPKTVNNISIRNSSPFSHQFVMTVTTKTSI